MAQWKIRKALPHDAHALSVCVEAAYARYAERIDDLPAVSDGLADDIATRQVWVAEIGDDVVGGLVLAPEDGFMRLANVAVHPDHKGAGLGRTLIALAEAETLAQGYRELRLTTHAKMPETIRLYTRLGWEEERRRGNKVAMKKSI